MTVNNTIKANNEDIEVYESSIYYYADEYINTLIDPEKDIYNSNCFDSMLNYIYKKVFKPKKGDYVLYNSHSNLDLNNIELLDDIFNVLCELCGKYKKHITILRYSTLTGIDRDTIKNWSRGTTRKGEKASSAHLNTAKSWFEKCESTLLSGTVDDNSVGCIFALKANYGYSDQPTQKIEIVNGKSDPGEIAADIASRHITSESERPVIPVDIDISDT